MTAAKRERFEEWLDADFAHDEVSHVFDMSLEGLHELRTQ